MRKSVRVARLLLGIIFLVFGLNRFYTFISVPLLHTFLQILVSSGYIHIIKGVEVLAGILLLANRGVLLAIVLLGADIANIVAYHSLVDHRNWPAAVIVMILYSIVIYGYWPYVRVLFQWKIQAR